MSLGVERLADSKDGTARVIVVTCGGGFDRPGNRRSVTAKNKEDAKAEGYKRGLAGKKSAAGMTEGWTDDKAAGTARSEGYVAGGRKRAQSQLEAAKKAKRTK